MATVCKKCGRQIAWMKTAAGRSMPVEPKRIYGTVCENGPVTILTEAGRLVRIKDPGDMDGKNLILGYIPHWARCTAAKSIRREIALEKQRSAAARKTEEAAKAPKQISFLGG